MQPYPGVGSSQERTWAMAAHWSGLAVAIVTAGWLGPLGPLVVMLAQGKNSPRVRAAAIEALNFQITMAIGFIISYILMGVGIGVVLLPLLGIVNLVFALMGTMAESQGRPYRYPFAIRFLK